MLTPLARRSSVAWYCCVSEPPDAQQARQGLFTTAADQTDPRLHVVPVPLPMPVPDLPLLCFNLCLLCNLRINSSLEAPRRSRSGFAKDHFFFGAGRSTFSIAAQKSRSTFGENAATSSVIR